jgi:DNA-binding MarR family transcriptional regulator
MTVLVRVLEESGLVERRGDASDKRVALVCLTEAGASYVQSRRQAGVAALTRLIDGLADDEVEALAVALPALARLAELESQDREGLKRDGAEGLSELRGRENDGVMLRTSNDA